MQHIRQLLVVVATLAIASSSLAQSTDDATAEVTPEEVTTEEVAATDEQQAMEAFKEGRAAYDIGSYDKALTKFEEALRLSGKPEMYFNIGQAHDKLGQDKEAIDAFETFLIKVPDTPRRLRVETRIRHLRRAVAEKEALQAQINAPPPKEEKGGTSPWVWIAIGAGVVAVGVVVAILLTRPKLPEDDFGGAQGLSISW